MHKNFEWLRHYANERIQKALQEAEDYRLAKLVAPNREHVLLSLIKRGVIYCLSVVGKALKSINKKIIVHLIVREGNLIDR